MRAQILYGIGNIKYAETGMPSAGSGQALIRLRRSGICGSDIPRIFKTGAHNMPLIPGHEMMGVVEKCAERSDLEGKRVGIFPLLPCHKCRQCRSGHYEMCENYNYLGSRCDGGFAEYVIAPVWNLIPIPDSVSDDAAAMLEPMSVAVHAIRGLGLIPGSDLGPDLGETSAETEDRPGRATSGASVSDNPGKAADTPALDSHGGAADNTVADTTCPNALDSNIVVCGLGTIGLFVAMFLKDAGYRNVYCIGNKDIQLKKITEMGYARDFYCDVRRTDPVEFVKKVTGGGADYYFECIGLPESYSQAIKCTGPLGKVMMLGNPKADMNLDRDIYWKILRNQMTLKGTWNSSFPGFDSTGNDDWRYVLERLDKWQGGEMFFDPESLITHRFALDRLEDGLDIMRNKTEEYIKIMLEL